MRRVELKDENVKGKHKIFTRIILLLLILSGIYIYNTRGTAPYEELKGIEVGTSIEKVNEYFGSPRDKTINRNEILEWAPENIVASEASYPELEMYTYVMESGNMARLFFSLEKLIYKDPVGLNIIE